MNSSLASLPGSRKPIATVTKQMLNTKTPGSAVISQAIASHGLREYSRTGIEPGTGDVVFGLAETGVVAGRLSNVIVDVFGRIVGGDTASSLILSNEKQTGSFHVELGKFDALEANTASFENVVISKSLTFPETFVLPMLNGGIGSRNQTKGSTLVGTGNDVIWRKLSISDLDGLESGFVVPGYNDSSVHVKEFQFDVLKTAKISGVLSIVDGVAQSLGYTPESKSLRGVPGGYASLDDNGFIAWHQIPGFKLGTIHTFGDEQTMLACEAEQGDIAVRTDSNETFILACLPASNVNNWKPAIFQHKTDGVVFLQNKTPQNDGVWLTESCRFDSTIRVESGIVLGTKIPSDREGALYYDGRNLRFGESSVVTNHDLENYLTKSAKAIVESEYTFLECVSFHSGIKLAGSDSNVLRSTLGSVVFGSKALAYVDDVVTINGDQSVDGKKSFKLVDIDTLNVGKLSITKGFDVQVLEEIPGVDLETRLVVVGGIDISRSEITFRSGSRSFSFHDDCLDANIFVANAFVLKDSSERKQSGFTTEAGKLYFGLSEFPVIKSGMLETSDGYRVNGIQTIGRQQPNIVNLVDNSSASASATIANLVTTSEMQGAYGEDLRTLVSVEDSNSNNNFTTLLARYNELVAENKAQANAIASVNAKLNQVLSTMRKHGLIAT